MIRTIQRFFAQRIEECPDSEHALRLATAALFLEMTRADFEVRQEETAMVTRAVRQVLKLSEEETAEILQLADKEARESVSLFQFTKLVNEGFSPAEKKEVIELLWRVAFADSELDKHEEHLVRKVANLLHVPHPDFIEAKRRARRTHEEAQGE